MNRSQKNKLLDRIDKEMAEFNAIKHYVFYCNNCNFKITVSDKIVPYIECQVGNYYEFQIDKNKYGKYISENETNINGTMWSRLADSICLNCGNTVLFKDIKHDCSCDKCNGKNFIFWKNLPQKNCPSCNGYFEEGILFNTDDELSEWNFGEWIEMSKKAKKKHGINDDVEIKKLTNEEKKIMDKEIILLQHFMDERYVISNNYNIIKFNCHRSFHSPFCILVEWFKDEDDAKIIFCMRSFGDEKKYSAKNFENYKLKILLSILEKYKFFTKPNKIKRFGLDGSTWTLEVQIGNLYKEIDVWSPEKGVIHDIGKLLIEYSGEIINELY